MDRGSSWMQDGDRGDRGGQPGGGDRGGDDDQRGPSRQRDRSDSRNFSPQTTQEDLEWKSGKCDVDLMKVLNAMKESDLSKLTKLQTHELETWLSKVTRTMDGVHPMVSRYFRFVKKMA